MSAWKYKIIVRFAIQIYNFYFLTYNQNICCMLNDGISRILEKLSKTHWKTLKTHP